MIKIFLTFLLLTISAFNVGCTPVAPWQKEKLSLGHMAFEPDPLEAKFRQHTYASKEGTSIGYGVGGGGCGCN